MLYMYFDALGIPSLHSNVSKKFTRFTDSIHFYYPLYGELRVT